MKMRDQRGGPNRGAGGVGAIPALFARSAGRGAGVGSKGVGALPCETEFRTEKTVRLTHLRNSVPKVAKTRCFGRISRENGVSALPLQNVKNQENKGAPLPIPSRSSLAGRGDSVRGAGTATGAPSLPLDRNQPSWWRGFWEAGTRRAEAVSAEDGRECGTALFGMEGAGGKKLARHDCINLVQPDQTESNQIKPNKL